MALVAELVVPHEGQGLFGSFDNAAVSVFAAHGLLLITASAVRPSLSC